jgi:hypothetical protein
VHVDFAVTITTNGVGEDGRVRRVDEDLVVVEVELEFDDGAGAWRVTVGFSRPWDRLDVPALAALTRGTRSSIPRSYKVVHIDDASGRVVSVKARDSSS